MDGLGWAYWQWKYYHDPTGSSKEALVSPTNVPGPQAKALIQTYPEAIAGVQLTLIEDAATGAMLLDYHADPKITAPTLIYVPVRYHFPHGYCAKVKNGGPVLSKPGATMLEIQNPPTARTVHVTISAGTCK